jgi:hypothetical protein
MSSEAGSLSPPPLAVQARVVSSRRKRVALVAGGLFVAQNSNEVPAIALWLSNIVVSLFIISTYWSRDAFNFMLNITSVTTLLPGPLSSPWRSCAGSTA